MRTVLAFKALVEDIKERKQQEPIWLYEDKILDGRNRYRACQQLGIEVDVRTYHKHKSDPVSFVLSVNLHRRHLNEGQRAMVAAKLANLDLGANQHSEGTSTDAASKLLNVSRSSVDRARAVLAKGDPSLVEAVEGGAVSLTEAANTAKSGKGSRRRSAKPNASDAYDKAEEKLIEKLQKLSPKSADAAVAGTIKQLRSIVTAMKAAASAADEEDEEQQDEAA
jgi:ParB-like chromosome segregation protein Spo0J